MGSSQINANIEVNEKRIKDLKSRIEIIEAYCNTLMLSKPESQPFQCPNCAGTGTFKERLNLVCVEYRDCHSCQGKGIVWRD